MERVDKTFLEILLEELPKRGGWPEHAIVAKLDSDSEVRFMFDCEIEHDFFLGYLSNDAENRTGTDVAAVNKRDFKLVQKILLNMRFGKC